MTWGMRYRIRYYVSYSFWVLPTAAMVAALIAIHVTSWIEGHWWTSNIDSDVARTVLIALSSSMFTFIVFVCSMLLLAVQLASAQLTPRIIGFVFKSRVTKFSLAMFVFAFTYCIAAVVRINSLTPALTMKTAVYSCIASLAIFFFLIDNVAKSLRPAKALRDVAMQGRKVIQTVYPRSLAEVQETSPAPVAAADCNATVHSTKDGVILACDVEGMLLLARRNKCVLELAPQVGDFVAVGDPLFKVFGTNASTWADELLDTVALGNERSFEQDPAFAFRIIVDIACKALSPAINDPTTAVHAIDQLHHLLRQVGRRNLEDERIHDADGRLRLIYKTRNWEDFVHLAVTEIRHFGSESIQVTRRLRAMLENLIDTLPVQRVGLLRAELSILERSASSFFTEPEDRAMAAVSDRQGVGGRQE